MLIRKGINLFIHLLIWVTVAYILNQIFTVELRTINNINGREVEHIELHSSLTVILIALLFKAVFFYLNGWFKLRELIRSRQWKKYASLISLFGSALFGIEWLVINLADSIFDLPLRPFHFFWFDLLLYIITLGLSLACFLTLEWNKAEQLTRIITEERLRTELDFLKAQINPHFFLNTLNNLYSMAQAGDIEDLEEGILQLSAMMRYILYECREDTVSLEKEIEYIKSYIGLTLMRYRPDGNLKVEFNAGQMDSKNFMIAPVLLIPFVENAFKHGISLEKESSINIYMTIVNSDLLFLVKNTDNCNHNGNFDNSGIGIANVKRRLEMLYPGKYSLDIQNKDGFYSVLLNITGNELYHN